MSKIPDRVEKYVHFLWVVQDSDVTAIANEEEEVKSWDGYVVLGSTKAWIAVDLEKATEEVIEQLEKMKKETRAKSAATIERIDEEIKSFLALEAPPSPPPPDDDIPF